VTRTFEYIRIDKEDIEIQPSSKDPNIYIISFPLIPPPPNNWTLYFTTIAFRYPINVKHERLVIEYPRKLLPFSQAQLDELKNLVKNANQAYQVFLKNQEKAEELRKAEAHQRDEELKSLKEGIKKLNFD
jgi:hypothetical protein